MSHVYICTLTFRGGYREERKDLDLVVDITPFSLVSSVYLSGLLEPG